jgi:hypothetical protein
MARELKINVTADTKDADGKLKKTSSVLERLGKVSKTTVDAVKAVGKILAVSAAAFTAAAYGVTKLVEEQGKLAQQKRQFEIYGDSAIDALKGIEDFAGKAKLNIGELRGSALELIEQGWKPDQVEKFFKTFATGAATLSKDSEQTTKYIQDSFKGLLSLGEKKKISLGDLESVGIVGKQLEELKYNLSAVDFESLEKGTLPVAKIKQALLDLADENFTIGFAEKDPTRSLQGISNSVMEFKENFTKAMFGTSEESASSLNRIDLAFQKVTEALNDPTISAGLASVGSGFVWLVENGIELFVDALYSIGPTISSVSRFFDSLMQTLEPFTPVFVAIAGAVAALGVAYLVTLVPAMIAATVSAIGLAAAFIAANAPILLIGAAIGLLIYYWDDLVNEFKHGTGFIGEALRQIVDWGTSVYKVFEGVYELISALFTMDFNKMSDAALKVAKNMANVYSGGFSNRLLGDTPEAQKLSSDKDLQKLSNQSDAAEGGNSVGSKIDSLKQLLAQQKTSKDFNPTKNGIAGSMYAPNNSKTSKTNNITNNTTVNITGNSGVSDINKQEIVEIIHDVLDDIHSRSALQSIG